MEKQRKRRPRAEAEVARILEKQRSTIRLTTLAVFILRVVPVVVPLVLRLTLDTLLDQKTSHLFGLDFSPRQLLVVMVGTGVLVALVRAIGIYFYVMLAGKSGHMLVADLRIAMFEHILRLPVSYADRRGVGKILLRFIGDSDALRSWVSRTSPAIVADRLLVLILLAAMFFVKWQLAIMILIPLPLVLLAMRKLSPRLQTLTRESRSFQATLTGVIESRLSSLRQAKWLDRGGASRRPVRTLAGAIAEQNIRRDRHAALVKSTGQFLAYSAVPLLIGFGVWAVWSNAATVGQCVAAVWLAAHLSVTVNRLAAAVVIQQKAAVSLERILRLLERSAERGRSTQLPLFEPAGESITCRDLIFCQTGAGSPEAPLNLVLEGPGVVVLEPHLDTAAFYEVLLGFAPPKSGELLLDSQHQAGVQVGSARQAIGWLAWPPVLFEGGVLENICLANPGIRQKDAAKIILQALAGAPGADARSRGASALALWLRKPVGPNGQDLTSEERFRVGICRLLVMAPAFVLVDDVVCSDRTADELRLAILQLSKTALVCVAARTATRLGFTADGNAVTGNNSPPIAENDVPRCRRTTQPCSR